MKILNKTVCVGGLPKNLEMVIGFYQGNVINFLSAAATTIFVQTILYDPHENMYTY